MWERHFYDLATVAARQHGLVTTAQAGRVGVDGAALDRLREAGLIVTLGWEVHQLAGTDYAPAYAYKYAAWLALSPERFGWERPEPPTQDCVLSHESAAALYGIGRLPAPFMVFTAPDERPAPQAVTIRVAPLARDEVVVRDGLPVTTAHRTILDLLRDRITHDDLGRAISDAVRKDLVDLRELYHEMAPQAGFYGFPGGGDEFLRHFTPDLVPDRLSARNRRGYAALRFAERVGRIRRRVRELVADARRDAGGPAVAEDEPLSEDIAAEIVGHLGWQRFPPSPGVHWQV